MRFCFILICCLLIPDLLHNGASQTPESTPIAPYIEHEEKQFQFYPGGKLEIAAGVPGGIKLMGWEKASVQIEAEKIVYYLPPENARALLEQCRIRVQWSQTLGTIQTSMPLESDATV